MPFPDSKPDIEDIRPFPFAVQIAGIVWLLSGLGGTLTAGVLVVLAGFPLIPTTFLGLFSAYLVLAGARITVRREADVAESAMFSLLIGLFMLLGAEITWLGFLRLQGTLSQFANPVVMLVTGLSLSVASGLALVGRRTYLSCMKNSHPRP